jgi:hypothetical protein
MPGGSTVVFITGVRRCSSWRLGTWGPLVRPASMQLGGVPSFLLAQPLGTGYLEHCLYWTRRQNSFWKCTNTRPARQGDVAGWPHLGLVEPVLCPTSFPRVIFSVIMPYIGHTEGIHGVWSIWCFSIIWCSWTGRSTKLVDLISNKHLSSISWMKCRYVGSRYMHFMTANTPPTHT